MVSIAGKLVAEDVIKTVFNGEIPNKKDLQINHGYSVKSAQSNKAFVTEGYKTTINTFVGKMIAERNRLIASMKKKDLSKVDYGKHLMGLDILTKDINLLSDEPTERIQVNQTIEKLNALIISVTKHADTTTENTLQRTA
jgi:hypothetical protein